jgi:hypothetical protein
VLAKLRSMAVIGIDASEITIEANISEGIQTSLLAV